MYPPLRALRVLFSPFPAKLRCHCLPVHPPQAHKEAESHKPASASHAHDKKPAPQPEPEHAEVSEEEREAAAKKAAALKEKELGNEAYKKKEFETAIAHYNKAIELYDGDMTFLTNRAAVFFEQVRGCGGRQPLRPSRYRGGMGRRVKGAVGYGHTQEEAAR